MKLIIIEDGKETSIESEPGEWCYVEYSPSFKALGLKDGFVKIKLPLSSAPQAFDSSPSPSDNSTSSS